jgi:hypothetical protein
MSTTLVKCSCSHEFQDKQYGKGVRVANVTGKGALRCTVCSKEHEARYPTHSVKPKGKKK